MNISNEAVEALASVIAKEDLERASADGYAIRIETLLPAARRAAKRYLEAAAPHLMESAFVRGYQSALADRSPINQASNRRAPKWSRKHRAAGAGE